LFLKGIAIGIAIAAPVGPVAVLCIRRTLQFGHGPGFASGLGAVTADVFFGALASFGVAAISTLLFTYETFLRGAGGVFMLVLGVRTWFKTSGDEERKGGERIFSSYMSAFFLTITNPITIFAFTAIFAGFGVVSDSMTLQATLALISGVTLGCVAWWLGLTLIAGLFRSKIDAGGYGWLHHLSGGLLLIFGIASIGSLIFF
jgi:threonine/homoserine/homoserine lactone efflux protein